MSWFRAQRKGIIELPTGTGKTYIGMKVMEYYYLKGKNVCIIVPTEVLMKQWKEKILKHTQVKSYDVGFLYGKEKQIKRVTIAIINTAVKFLHILRNHFDLFILDEVHHYYAPVWFKLINAIYPEKDILGLTATHERADRRHEKSPLPIVYSKTYAYMQNRGYVAPIKVEVVRVPLTFEERMIYEELEEKIRQLKNKIDNLPYEVSKEDYEREYERLHRQLMILINKRKQLCSEAVNKLPVIYEIVKRELEENPNSKILVFTESIRTVIQIRDYLEKHGIKCGVVHSKVKHRDVVLNMWKRGIFNVLLTVRVLDEGIDVPECNVGIIVSNSLTRRQLVQRIGRIVRPRPNKVAKIYIVTATATFEERIARLIREVIYKTYY